MRQINHVGEIFCNSAIRLLDIAATARRAGFSRWHMQRIFKQHTGITLGRYIRILRLSNAAIDLINTAYPVIEIALQYGYESQQTFTRAMKCHTGFNPGAIKRMPAADKDKLVQEMKKLIGLVGH
ncbi:MULTISPECIES: helix-turn-helix domain-containing protein [unclassified Enterobacter]|uniref:helix-turn-helix domain-containing protein n=1 Tax=unclassified Enterobacter TaxID=2608935 RepID=UPI00162160C4|nr:MULTISPECIES: helix-turn-helix domain-containing protein [unclassified Enterobacter]